MRRYLLLFVALIFIYGLTACTRIFPWYAYRDGIEYEGDTIYVVRSVELRVVDFGVVSAGIDPIFILWIRNGGSVPVEFNPGESWISKGEDRAYVDWRGNPDSITIEPGDSFKEGMGFKDETLLDYVPREDPTRKDLRLEPSILELHLSPLVIGGAKCEVPVLMFSDTNSEKTSGLEQFY